MLVTVHTVIVGVLKVGYHNFLDSDFTIRIRKFGYFRFGLAIRYFYTPILVDAMALVGGELGELIGLG